MLMCYEFKRVSSCHYVIIVIVQDKPGSDGNVALKPVLKTKTNEV